tara:strand:+ start:1559 stop:2902 length:1344 start_codon:yes stop_codon:yes gene_type:complete
MKGKLITTLALLSTLLFSSVSCKGVFRKRSQTREMYQNIAAQLADFGWAKDEIRTDYREGNQENRRVQFKRLSLEEQTERADQGHNKFHGRYEAAKDLLILPTDSDGKITQEGILSIPHEIVHILMDSKGRKGLMYSDTYEGPNLEDIAKHTKSRMNSDQFSEIREAIQYEMQLQHFIQNSKIIDYFMNRVNETLKLAKMISVHTKKDKEMKKEFSEFVKSYGSYAQIVINASDWKDKALKNAKNSANFEKDFAKTQTQLRKYSFQFQMLQAYQKDVTKLAYRVSENKDLDTYDSFRIIQQAAKVSKLRHSLPPSFTTHLMNMLQVTQTHYDGEEFMARLVKSLHRLYFDKPNGDMFYCTKEDRSLARQMKHDGQELFGSLIDRYDLAERMKNDGMPINEVRSNLLGKDKVEYKGQEYTFPQTQFKFKGELGWHNFSKLFKMIDVPN